MSKIESTLWQNIISMKKLLQSNIETLSKISVVGLVLINICVDMGHIGHFISALFHAWSTWNTSHKSTKQLNSTAQKMIRRKLTWNNVALNPNLEIDWTWDLHIWWWKFGAHSMARNSRQDLYELVYWICIKLSNYTMVQYMICLEH